MLFQLFLSTFSFFCLFPLTELNDKVGGNILTYNESEDAYYIQYGADAVPKKLQDSLELSASNILQKNTTINYTTTKSYSLLILVGASGSIAGAPTVPPEHTLTASGFTNIVKTSGIGENAN